MAKQEPVYLMVIAPHPDDPEFGIGGTVARLTGEGKRVVYVICTRGDKGTSDRSLTPEKLTVIREKEQRAAAKTLGVSEVVFLGYHDQELEDTREFRRDIVRLIRRYRPRIVATPDPYRRYMWHRDHRMAGQVTADAVYPYARDYLAYPELIEEGLEPFKVREVWFWGTDDPNYKSDISGTFEMKLAALGCHKSQLDMGLELRKRMLDWAKASAEGTKYALAEAFHREEMRM